MAKQKRSRERSYIINRRFLEHVNRVGVPSRDLYDDIGKKMALLRTYGYDTLYIEGGSKLPLSECSEARITNAFLKTLDNARTQVAKFEEAAKNDSDRMCLVQLVGLLESERKLAEEQLVEVRERQGIIMDSAPDHILHELSRQYGDEAMGDYYR